VQVRSLIDFESKMFSGPKWSPSSLPDFSSKTCLITGANTGIGKITVLELAKKNMTIYLATRNAEKAEQAIADIKQKVPNANIEFIKLDVSDLEQVKSVAERFVKEHPTLNYLVNNAGIMATPYEIGPQGYEMQWATNYMGHVLLTRILLPVLQNTAESGEDVRIINVSSYAHNFAPKQGIDFDNINLENSSTWTRYGQSKLGNILFNNELVKRYPNIKSFVLHPGFIRTDLYNGMNASYGIFGRIGNFLTKPFYLSPYQGALTSLYCFSPDADQNVGKYLVPFGQVGKPTHNAVNKKLGSTLWKWTSDEFTKKNLL